MPDSHLSLAQIRARNEFPGYIGPWDLQTLAEIVLAVHLIWILWVIFGAFWTRGHPFLAGLHIASIVWGVLVELTPWPCPLTLIEQFFETAAGADPYRGSFLLHYLDRIVYPRISESLLVYLGVAVCAANLAVYLWRAVRFVRSGNPPLNSR